MQKDKKTIYKVLHRFGKVVVASDHIQKPEEIESTDLDTAIRFGLESGVITDSCILPLPIKTVKDAIAIVEASEDNEKYKNQLLTPIYGFDGDVETIVILGVREETQEEEARRLKLEAESEASRQAIRRAGAQMRVDEAKRKLAEAIQHLEAMGP